MKSFRPFLALYAGPALLVALLPATHGTLLYDRAAVLHGEWWRLWTGHWVHFYASHLFWNLAVLLVTGGWLEQIRPGALLRCTLFIPPLISIAFLVFAPAMQAYGGLSGLATATTVLLALAKLADDHPARAQWLTVLLLVAVKIILDGTLGRPLFSDFSGTAIHTSALAHAMGAILAAVLFLSLRTGSCLPLSGSGPAGLDQPGKFSR